jgi:hypothetical protein
MPKRRYPPVGACIYCGSTVPLLAMNMSYLTAWTVTDVLPNASCKVCATITSKVER